MRGYTLFAELPETRRSKAGSKKHLPFTRATLEKLSATGTHINVTAVLTDSAGKRLWISGTDKCDAFGANNFQPNSPSIELCTPSHGYLREKCVRVNEALARKLHPNLFRFLDAD